MASRFGRRLLNGLAKLRVAAAEGKVPAAVLRRAFAFLMTFGSVLVAALATWKNWMADGRALIRVF
jgi:hypothetical protein